MVKFHNNNCISDLGQEQESLGEYAGQSEAADYPTSGLAEGEEQFQVSISNAVPVRVLFLLVDRQHS